MTTLASFWNLERSLRSTQMTRKEKTRRRIRKYALKKKKKDAWMLGALQSNVDTAFLIFLDSHNLFFWWHLCVNTVVFQKHLQCFLRCVEPLNVLNQNNTCFGIIPVFYNPIYGCIVLLVKVSLFISLLCQPVKF